MTEHDPAAPDFAAMEARLLDEVRRRRTLQRIRRRRRRLGLAGGGLAIALVGAAAWIALAPPDFADRGASCFSAADPSAPSIEIATESDAAGRPVAADRTGRTAERACAAAWTAGLVDGTPRPDVRLLTCRGSDDALRVFPLEPDTTTCAGLGLVEP